MIEVTQLQRDNAISAKEMWNSVPEKNVMPDLDTWRHFTMGESVVPTCNTIACFGGWCAVWPPFQDQGVQPSRFGSPTIYNNNNNQREAYGVDTMLFGVGGLFAGRGGHLIDNASRYKDSKAYKKISDWQIVMNRIDDLILNSVIIQD